MQDLGAAARLTVPFPPEEPALSTGPEDGLEASIGRAAAHLLSRQRADGHWVFELEADATIPSEFVMLKRFFGITEPEREARIGRYLRRLQEQEAPTAGGGWPLFHAGPIDISCSVKAYFALRLIGDAPDAPHMVRARRAILAAGGAEKSNVFTRAALALFGQVPWRAVPVMPPEIILLPKWFPFHLSKISYWARTVLVPLTVLMARRPQPLAPIGVELGELFNTPPDQVRQWPGGAHAEEPWKSFFAMLDALLQPGQRLIPRRVRRTAEAACERFVTERLNGEDGLGAIYPAMANAVVMYHCLGVPPDDPRVVTAWAALEKLVCDRPAGAAGPDDPGETYVQPCLSPIWDTALAAHALLEAGGARAEAAVARGLDWLLPHQVTELRGDWAMARPHVPPGGWAFQYANPHYPDVDDTAVVVLAMDRARKLAGADERRWDGAIERATDWVVGMQSKGGGWGAFDADNTHTALNSIPFADHGALLDPPTADVSGRCLAMLAQLGRRAETDAPVREAVDYLLAEQEANGAWYGRWGVNYVYGTWSALTALNAAGLAPDHPAMLRAVDWLKLAQNPDGGWGEDGDTYPRRGGTRPDADMRLGPSTASQTAWALLALMAAGVVDDPAVERGAAWLMANQDETGGWQEKDYTGTGFPRVFYLRYHGYARIFPLWALARLRNLRRSNTRRVVHGL
jgi:squalene-hopene/tetraprenyl-beta-curcumene cyclase